MCWSLVRVWGEQGGVGALPSLRRASGLKRQLFEFMLQGLGLRV